MESGEPVGQGGAKLSPRGPSPTPSPSVRLDPGARREIAQAAHHLRRAQRRRVQELTVGGQPQAHFGDVRSAARTRQHAGGDLRRQRQRRAVVRGVAPGGAHHLRVAGVAADPQRLAVKSCSWTNRSLQERIERIRFGRSWARRRPCRRYSARCRGRRHRHLGADHGRDREPARADRARAGTTGRRAPRAPSSPSCGASPRTARFQLFGHVRGAFTAR